MAAPLAEATKAPATVGGLIYANQETGECTIDRDEVLGWVLKGTSVSVCGYFTYEWDGDNLVEAWH